MRKDREAEARLLTDDGLRQAKIIIGRAQARGTSIAAEAEARAKEIEGLADSQAAEFYPQLLANPELASFLRKLDTLRYTLGRRTTITIDSQTAPYSLLKGGPAILSSTATPTESD
jgi:regulator of protease activity HflC (stomatin/prohibitin superfamily)